MAEDKKIIVQQVLHTHVGPKFSIKFDKASGVKSGDGFSVEVNGDDLDQAQIQAITLYDWAKQMVEPPKQIETPVVAGGE